MISAEHDEDRTRAQADAARDLRIEAARFKLELDERLHRCSTPYIVRLAREKTSHERHESLCTNPVLGAGAAACAELAAVSEQSDRVAGKIDANTQALDALGDELTKFQGEVRGRFAQIFTRFDQLDSRFDGMGLAARFDSVHRQLDEIRALLVETKKKSGR